MYYYFYERSRDIVLKSRKGSKALSTPESMLIGLIAGKSVTMHGIGLGLLECMTANRFCDVVDQQPDMGHPNITNGAFDVRKRQGFCIFILEALCASS